MEYRFTLANCTGYEVAILVFHLSILMLSIIDFSMMVLSLTKRNLDSLTFISIGAVLMFFPKPGERQGIIGRRIFLIGVTAFLLGLVLIGNSNMCNFEM